MKHPITNSGFTLIEIVVGTLILSMLIVSLSALYFAVDRTQQRSQNLAAVTRTSELQLESLRNRHYNTLDDGETIDFTSELPDRIPEPRSAVVEVTQPENEPDLRRLDAIVTYEERGAAQKIELSTLIGSIGISQ